MAGFAIDHVQLTMPADGLEQARAFYGGLVGLAEIAQPAAIAGRGGAWFAVGDRQLHLEAVPAFAPAHKAHVALRVADFAALRTRLEAAGTRLDPLFRMGTRPGFFAYDPFGNWIEFVGEGVEA